MEWSIEDRQKFIDTPYGGSVLVPVGSLMHFASPMREFKKTRCGIPETDFPAVTMTQMWVTCPSCR